MVEYTSDAVAALESIHDPRAAVPAERAADYYVRVGSNRDLATSERAGKRGVMARRVGYIELGAATDVGRVRAGNEDAVLVMGAGSAARLPVQGVAFIAVADGMGGHQAGEVASGLAMKELAETARNWLQAAPAQSGAPSDLSVDAAALSSDGAQLLAEAVSRANSAIWAQASTDPAKEGMGTTLVCALVHEAGGRVLVANVGDSRAYAVTGADGQARQVTEDHSWVFEQVRAGRLSRLEAEGSPYRNVLTRSLGTLPEVEADLYSELTLACGDAVVLCSDGVTAYLGPFDVAAVLRGAATAQEAATRLVELAVERGGADNASAVVACMRSEGPARGK